MDLYTDAEVLAMDPDRLTIAKLKSVLSARGVELPTDKQKREHYVKLFSDYQATLKKNNKKRKSDADNTAGTPASSKKTKTSPTKGKATPSSKRKSNMFQQLPSPGGDVIVEEEETTKDKGTKKVRLPPPSFESTPSRQVTDTPVTVDPSSTSTPSVHFATTPSLPFSILQETFSSSTPYSGPSITTPSTTHTTATTAETPLSVNSNESTYSTPYVAKNKSHSTAGRTPFSTSNITDIGIDEEDASTPYGGSSRAEEGGSNNTTFAGHTPHENKRQSNVGRNREYEEERRQREWERQQILQEQERQRQQRIDADQQKKKRAERLITNEDEEEDRVEEDIIVDERVEEDVEEEESTEEEEVEEENKAPPRAPSSLPRYLYVAAVVLFWAAVVSVLGYFLVNHVPSASKFCDTDAVAAYDDCILCPAHGICSDGKLYCETGYVPSGAVCVEDKEIIRMSNSIADDILALLKEAKGKHLCNEAARGYLLEDEVKLAIIESKKYPTFKFDAAFPKAIELLNQDRKRFNVTQDGDRFESADATFGAWCSLVKQSRENWLYILIASFVVVIFSVMYTSHQRREKVAQEVKKLVGMAIAELKQKKVLHNEGRVKEPFVVATHIRDQLIRGTDDKINKQLWRGVEAAIRRKPTVHEAPTLLHGTQELTWEWVGTTTAAGTTSSHNQPMHLLHMQAAAHRPSDVRNRDVFEERRFR